MRINSHIPALTVQRQLRRTAQAIERSLERLSSGQRVNSARDDIAALTIGTRLEAQVRGLTQTQRGLNDALALSQVASAALGTQIEIVHRMREIAVQAANGTLSDRDRDYLNLELQELLEEFDRIGTETEFNGRKLLDGSFETTSIKTGASNSPADSLSLGLSSAKADAIFTRVVGDGTFTIHSTVAVGSEPPRVRLADLNGDGHLDAVSNASDVSYISVNLGNGDGTFSAARTYAVGAGGRDLVLMDYNHDGDLDAISSDFLDGTLSLLLGNGDGTFATRTTLSAGTNPFGLAVGDLNEDEIEDLVSTEFGGTQLRLFLGNARGTFQSPITLSAGTQPEIVTLADVNNDGHLDVASGNFGGSSVSILLGNGNGTFQTALTISAGTSPSHITFADLNQDGNLDLVNTNYAAAGTATVSIHLGNGNGTFQSRTTISVNAYPQAVEFEDMNGDDELDMFVTGSSGYFQVFLGTGGGSFGSATNYALNSWPGFRFAFGDLDEDGILDIAVPDGNVNGTISSFISRTHTVSAVSRVSVETQERAQELLPILDTALSALLDRSSSLGALQSRLNYTTSGNDLLQESLIRAKSELLDIDYANEMAELIRTQILQQAQAAVLAQANSQYQMVLDLLRF